MKKFLLNNRYEIREPVGRSAFWTEYEGWDQLWDQRVHVLQGSDPPQDIEEIIAVARSIKQMKHDNLLELIDIIRQDTDTTFIIQEWTATCLPNGSHRLPWERVILIADQLCNGLDLLHYNDISHNDIKPVHIRMNDYGQIKLSGFDICSPLEVPFEPGSISGTPNYMPPECWSETYDVNCRTRDIYSLGITLYELITGRLPFSIKDSLATLVDEIKNSVLPPIDLELNVPNDLVTIIDKCTRKDPRDRYQNIDQLQKALKDVTGSPMLSFLRGDTVQSTYSDDTHVNWELIRKGGFGTVYKATQTNLNRTVAIKEISTSDHEATGISITEAKLAASIGDPAIVPIFDVWTRQDKTYISMQFYPKSLHAYLNDCGKLDITDSLKIAIPVANALRRCHLQEIIHQDLTPNNILLSEENVPAICDFGLARLRTQQYRSKMEGTPGYMAPDQIDYNAPIVPTTDIYALGAVLFRMLTGDVPTISDKRSFHPDLGIPVSLQETIIKALKVDPRERFQNMSELLEQLESLQPRNRKELQDSPSEAPTLIDINKTGSLETRPFTARPQLTGTPLDTSLINAAIADLTDAHLLNPENVDILLKRAELFEKLEDIDAALSDLTDARLLDPENVDILVKRAQLFEKRSGH